MQKFKFNLYNEDCLEVLKRMASNSLDIICIDPPYLYLKGQKLERPFDERLFFLECARVLKKGGFIIMFGRGTSFYRWNTIISDVVKYTEGPFEFGHKVFDRNGNIINRYKFKEAFEFKEEIVWDKMQISSPLNALLRCHEVISIHSKGKSKLNKIKRPFVEAYKFDPLKIEQTLYRLTTTFGNRDTFKMVNDYFETGYASLGDEKERKFNATIQTDIKKRNRTLQFAVSMEEGITEKSIFKEVRDASTSIHPTQKPVRLLERLMKLVLPPEATQITVADFFAGSCSTGEACHNLANELQVEIEFTGCEIDEEYFDGGNDRLTSLK